MSALVLVVLLVLILLVLLLLDWTFVSPECVGSVLFDNGWEVSPFSTEKYNRYDDGDIIPISVISLDSVEYVHAHTIDSFGVNVICPKMLVSESQQRYLCPSWWLCLYGSFLEACWTLLVAAYDKKEENVCQSYSMYVGYMFIPHLKLWLFAASWS